MKRLTLKLMTGLLLISLYSSAQNKKMLYGDWIITKVILSKDSSETRSKYAEKGAYLKFSFSKKELHIANAPFDIGLELPISINKEKIKLIFPDFLPSVPESEFEINTLDSSNLILITTNMNNDSLSYYFKKILPNKNHQTSFEFKEFVIKKINYPHTRGNFVYIYDFKSNEYNILTPTYKDGPTLGTDLCAVTKFPSDFTKSKIIGPLKVKIEMDQKGKVTNVELLKGINDSIDKSVIKFMQKSKWNPLLIENQKIESACIFNISFLLVDDTLL